MTPDYLSAIAAEKRPVVIDAMKICEGDPATNGRKKKDGKAFTDLEWANYLIHSWIRGKLFEAEPKKRKTSIDASVAQIRLDFPEE